MTKPLSLYVHIPFCVKKCDYCDFLSFPANEGEQAVYFQALRNELYLCAKAFDLPRRLETVYFGGGTPSCADTEELCGLLEMIRKTFTVAPDAEITAEINPGTADTEKLQRFKEAGINRLSIGCQSMHDEELQLLGRIHTKDDILKTFHAAREAGFDNISVDLMAALPEQTFDAYMDSLRQLVELSPEHISAYSLMIEEDTPFYETYSEEVLDEDLDREMYQETDRFLSAAGYERYEISNYALRPEKAKHPLPQSCKDGYRCRHNMVYWLRGDYLGAGLGASSLMDNVRFRNTDRMEDYIAANGNPSTVREDVETLNIHTQMEEFMFLGLRMTEGISQSAFETTFHHPIRRIYAKALDSLLEDGLIEIGEDRIRLTPLGADVSNYALSRFLFDDEP